MTTEANFPLQLLCLKPALYGRLSLDHLWPLLGDHQGQKGKDLNRFTDDKEKAEGRSGFMGCSLWPE
jgi:hypothetical protein